MADLSRRLKKKKNVSKKKFKFLSFLKFKPNELSFNLICPYRRPKGTGSDTYLVDVNVHGLRIFLKKRTF